MSLLKVSPMSLHRARRARSPEFRGRASFFRYAAAAVRAVAGAVLRQRATTESPATRFFDAQRNSARLIGDPDEGCGVQPEIAP